MRRMMLAVFIATILIFGCEPASKAINAKAFVACEVEKGLCSPVAVDLKDFGGFETGGFEEIAVVGNDPGGGAIVSAIVTTPAPWHSNEQYIAKIEGIVDVGEHAGFVETEAFAIGTDWVTMGWWWLPGEAANIYASLEDPVIFQLVDGAGGAHWELEHSNSNELILNDANGISMATISNKVTKDTWMLMEAKWKRSGTGDFQLRINGELVADLTSDDLDTGTDSAALRWKSWDESHPLIDPQYPMHIDSWYFRTDDGANIDTNATFFGRYTVVGPFQDTNSGAAADYGDAADTGTWGNAGETPANAANLMGYNVRAVGLALRNGGISTDDGARPGPKDDSRINGIIRGASFMFWAEKQSGSATTRVQFKYGATSSASTDNTSNTGNIILTTTPSIKRVILPETDGDVPTSSEWFQLGMKITNTVTAPQFARADLLEAWGFILHEQRRIRVVDALVTQHP